MQPIHPLRCLYIILVLAILIPFTEGGAQTFRGNTYEIESIQLTGNESFSDGELLQKLSTLETPGFLGKLLFSISEALGSENQYFDETVFDEDVGGLISFYQDNGFPNAMVDTILTFSGENRTVDILLKISEGYRALVDSIQYAGLLHVAGEVWVGIDDDPFVEKGVPFQRLLVESEIRRVLDILHNEGYVRAAFERDSSGAFRVLSTGNYTVVMHFNKGDRFVFGDIVVEQNSDSLGREQIGHDVVLRQLDYKTGDIFSEAKRRSSERNLNRVGVFDQVNISIIIPPDSTSVNTVTSIVNLWPSDKHELAPEVSVSDEDKAFNLGTGLVYTQRNFLGAARTFTTRLRFRTQTLLAFPDYFEVNSDAVSNLDLSVEILQPYVFTNKIKGRWTTSIILDKQSLYRQEILKNTVGFAARIGHYSTAVLDWTLQRVRLRRNQAISIDLNDPAIKEQYDQLLIQEKEAQFNSIISYTMTRDKSNDLFSPSEGLIHSATIEESGLLPLILRQDLPFTQFYRLVLLGRWFFDPGGNRFSVLAFKLKGGFEEKYGESRSDTNRTIPQTHRFYAGGGGSVRGWNSRELSATGVPELGGNLSLESSLEWRANMFRAFHNPILDNIWLVWFLDVGDVWAEASDVRLNTLAVATGIGIRYDSFFGPFRIDFGIRVYDPKIANPDGRWITQRKFFKETVSQGVLHFGIGHAF